MKTLFLISVLLMNSLARAAVQVPCQESYVFCLDEFIDLSKNHGQSMESMILQLPTHVKRNLTFKRGNNIEKTINGKKEILGPHGHIAPSSESQSAAPDRPRVFVWDEKSGFSASWNSGDPQQTAADRVDLYDFDFSQMQHRLMSWTAKDGFADQYHKDQNGRMCVTCHGEVQRPIFPMYPDWPQFYGEFNDEMAGYTAGQNALRSDLKVMANEFQPKERQQYASFLSQQGQSNARYNVLFDVIAEDHQDNMYYPYRPRNTTSPSSDISRAFYYRPNLRLGVMYNRLTALQTFEKIKKSKVFKKFPDIMFYSLLDCNWDFVAGQSQNERAQILNRFLSDVQKMNPSFQSIHLRGAAFTAQEIANANKATFFEEKTPQGPVYYKHRKYTDVGYSQIPYEDLLKLLELQIADLDIRFRHDSSIKVAGQFGVYDPKAYYFTKSAMDIGYVEDRYALNPICDNADKKCNFSYNNTYMQGLKYFNSYFDGSATTNELLAAQMLIYLTDVNQDFSQEPELASVRNVLRQTIKDPQVYFETLMKKYSGFTERLKKDRTFFTRMDLLSPWLQLPYPPDLLNIHNRESFWGSSAKTTQIRLRHAQWATAADRAANKPNYNGGQNICWNVYNTMKARYK